MKIKRAILSTHPKIRNALLVIPLLFVLIIYFLQEGIYIEKFRIASLGVEGLYLKLDKKLILRAKKIRLPRDKRHEKLSRFHKVLDRLRRTLYLFEYIEFEDLQYTNDHYRILYADDIIYISDDLYEVASRIAGEGTVMRFDFPLLYIKKYATRMSGTVLYDYRSAEIESRGRYEIASIEGNYTIHSDRRGLSFSLSTGETSEIETLLNRFTIPREVENWLLERVKADSYRLIRFEGSGTLDGNRFVPDPDSLRGELRLEGASVRFDDTLSPVRAKSAIVRLENGGLYFDLEKPSYAGRSIDGSGLYLMHIYDPSKLELYLHIKYRGKVDKKILEILRRYDIDIPIVQKSGSVKASMDLKIPLYKGGKTVATGGISISRGVVKVASVPLKLKGGGVSFREGRVSLRGIEVADSLVKGVVDADLDLNSSKARANLYIGGVGGGIADVVSIHGERVKIDLSMTKESMQIVSRKLGCRIVTDREGEKTIHISDISRLTPYIKELSPIGIGGRLKVKTKNFDSCRFEGELILPEPFFSIKGKRVRKLPVIGSVDGRGIFTLKALGGKILYDGGKREIDIDGVDLDLKRVAQMGSVGGKSLQEMEGVKIEGRKSRLLYGKITISPESYTISFKKGVVTLDIVVGRERLKIVKKGDGVVIKGVDLSEKSLRAFGISGVIQGGRYSIYAEGKRDGYIEGVVRLNGTALKDFKAYNDLIALFNTVPALISFSDPGFSEKGYIVRRGMVEFRLSGDLLRLKKILLEGKSSTVAGEGTIDTKSGKVKVDLAIKTAREVGKVFGNLPIVGYIVFGEDKSLTTGIEVRGTLGEPIVKTHPIRDAIFYPLDLLRRTIASPARLGSGKVDATKTKTKSDRSAEALDILRTER